MIEELDTQWTADVASAYMSNMKSKLWLDQATRAVAVEFNVLSSDGPAYITVARIVIEISEAGRAYTSFTFITFPTSTYKITGARELLRILAEVVLNVILAFSCIVEFRVMTKLGGVKNYFMRRSASFLEFTCLCSTGLYLLNYYIWVSMIAGNQLDDGISRSAENKEFVDLWIVAQQFRSARNWAGVTMICLSFKFVYNIVTPLDDRASLLIKTIAHAGNILVHFLALVIFLVFGFIVCFNQMFGQDVAAFRSVGLGGSSLLLYTLGDFDYDSMDRLRRRDPQFFNVLFFSYEILVAIIVINMFIAIIILEFDVVRQRTEENLQWKYEIPSIIHDFRLRFDVATFRCFARCRGEKELLILSDDFDKSEELYEEDPSIGPRRTKPQDGIGSVSSRWNFSMLSAGQSRLEKSKSRFQSICCSGSKNSTESMRRPHVLEAVM